MNCEHCGIETTGVQADGGQSWPICGPCFGETWTRLQEEDARARDAEAATYDPLTICARCRFTWPVSELSGGVCPDCNLRAWEIASTREVLR